MNCKKEALIFGNTLTKDYTKIIFTIFFEFVLLLILFLGSRFVLTNSIGIIASAKTVTLFILILIITLLVYSFFKTIVYRIITGQKELFKLYPKFILVTLIWGIAYIILALLFKGVMFVLFGQGQVTGFLSITLAYVLPLLFMIIITYFSVTTSLFTTKKINLKQGFKSIYTTSIKKINKLWPIVITLVIFAIIVQLLAFPIAELPKTYIFITAIIMYQVLSTIFRVYFHNYLEKKKLY